MKAKYIKTHTLASIALLSIGIAVIISCSSDEIVNTDTTNPDVSSPSGTLVEGIDKELFTLLKRASDEFDKNKIWNGYNFSSAPMYFIYRDSKKKALRGFLVSPGKEIEGASKIENSENQGLEIYRYDIALEKANQAIEAGNGVFEFDFGINNVKFYLQVYTDSEVRNVTYGAIQLAVHEVFHIYQFNQWEFVPGFIQDQNNYPITEDLLSLQLLTARIAEKMPRETNGNTLKKYLEMYVAIRTQEMSMDPSANALVKNMANAQEHGEGTAKYIENQVSYKIIPGFEEQFNFIKFREFNKKSDVRNYFGFGIWYDTGAAVAYMLSNQGIVIEGEIAAGKTLYDIAKKHVNLSPLELTDKLTQAKDEFDWPGIQAEAKRLMQL